MLPRNVHLLLTAVRIAVSTVNNPEEPLQRVEWGGGGGGGGVLRGGFW